jgi:hypothetical protein
LSGLIFFAVKFVARVSFCIVDYESWQWNQNSMVFQPGESGNPSGRKVGSRNKLNRDFHEAYDEAKARGYKHPFLRMMEIAYDETQPVERRDGMLREAASYVCPKPRQTVAIETQLPEDISATDLGQLLKDLSHELEPAELMSMLLSLAKSRREDRELQLKIDHIGDASQPTRIEIVGGLPPLAVRPGEPTVIMPGDQMNGHQGPVIEHQEEPPPEKTP